MKRILEKIATMTIVLMTILSTISGIPSIRAEPMTIRVPDDYNTIQGAIDAANPGDTIFVASGTYKEHLKITKSLSLIGENKDTTIVDGENQNIHTVFINRTNNVEINGFTIKNITSGTRTASNIHIEQCDGVKINETIVCHGKDTYNIWARKSTNVHIFNSEVFDSYFGITITDSTNCTIENSKIHDTIGTAVGITDSCTVRKNIICGNYRDTSGWISHGIKVWGSNNKIVQNVIYHQWDYIKLNGYNNTILENKLIASTNSPRDTGIRFGSECGTGHKIIGNTFTDFASSDCYALCFPTANNYFYYNNFIGSNEIRWGTAGPKPNTWDDGTKGNYWSDYNGQDLNGDGIGDTNLPKEGVDFYPLMNPYNTPDNSIAKPTAFIDEIKPNPSIGYASFKGHGDTDGIIIEYHWSSSLSGFLSDQQNFEKNDLETGTHQINFKVRNDDGLWSPTVTETLIVTIETSTQLELLVNYEKNNIIKVPFETSDEAKDYVENFETNGEPPKDFGTIPLDLTITNKDISTAQNVVIDLSVSVIAVLYELNAVAIFSDIAKPISKSYPLDNFQSVGTVDAGGSKLIHIDTPVYYASVIVGTLTVDLQTPEEDKISFDIFITLVILEVTLTIRGSNFESVVYTTPTLHGLGDPTNMLKEINEKLAERVQEIQLREMLKQYYSVAIATQVQTVDITAGQRHMIDTTIEPGTKILLLTALIPAGVKLIELSAKIGAVTYGITTSAITGFAMIFISDLTILQLQKAFITVESASPPVNITLRISTIGTPDFYLDMKPTFKEIRQGESATYTVNVTSCYEFNSDVSFSIAGSFSDMTFDFNPIKVTVPEDGHAESTLRISTSNSVSPKLYNITILGENGTMVRSFQISLNITQNPAPPTKTLSVTLTTNSTEVSSKGTLTVTVTVTDGTNPVVDANVVLSVDKGSLERNSGVTDENGKFTTTYNAPTVTNQETITIFAEASKSGYNQGSNEKQIIVKPLDIEKSESNPIRPEFILLGIVLAAIVLSLLWHRSRKNRKKP